MAVFQRMLDTQVLMMLYMLAGIIASKTHIIKQEGRSSLIGVLIDITLPMMILNSFQMDVTREQLMSAGVAMLISAGCCMGGLGVGKLLWRRHAPEKRAVLDFATMFSNAGNAGLPIVSLVFGAEGVFYASFFLIPLRVLMWTVGLSLYVPGKGAGKLKNLLTNPSVMVVVVGLAMIALRVRLPGALASAVSNIGSMTGPLSMMMIGASLADMKPRDALSGEAAALALVRLVALPLITLGVLSLLNVEPLLRQVCVTLMAMPAATNTAILAEMYGCDYPFGAKCVFVSTVLSLATVPLMTLLF